MSELQEICEGKTKEELIKELDFQIAKGENIGGTICSFIYNQINNK